MKELEQNLNFNESFGIVIEKLIKREEFTCTDQGFRCNIYEPPNCKIGIQ